VGAFQVFFDVLRSDDIAKVPELGVLVSGTE